MDTERWRGILSPAGRRGARLLGGIAVLVLLARRLGSGPFVDALRAVRVPTLAAAVAIGALTTVLAAWRWTVVARGLGLRLPLGDAVGACYRALFLNAVLPGGVLGDVGRAVRHGRGVGDVALAVRAVVLERCAGQLALGAATGAVLVFDRGAVPVPAVPGGAVAAVALPVALVAVIGSAVPPVRRRIAAWGREAAGIVTSPAGAAGVGLTSVAILAGHLATFVLAARAAGVTAATTRLVPLALLALLAMSLPLNVGGWGPREGVMAWAFAASGLDAAQGLTTSVVYGLFALAASLPGAAAPLAQQVAGWGAAWSAERLPGSPAVAPAPATGPVAP